MKELDSLREHVLNVLKGRGAHADFEDAIADFPADLRGAKTEGIPYSPWELLEHIRIAQWDILEFSRNPEHVSPKWPDGYWPKEPIPPNASAWNKSVKSARSDLKAVQDLVAD